MGRRLAEFVPHGSRKVFIHPDRSAVDYSDGAAAEEGIGKIISDAADLGSLSNELSHRIHDWPSEYHLSQKRANLLRHLRFDRGDRILEIGGGCGAITRFLGETGASVTVVEGSLRRALITAERTRDLDTVTVYCANADDIQWDRRFDVVVMVGVLEYAPVYFKDATDAIGHALSMVVGLLESNGRFILAIENRNGLKYFNGLSEDHVGRPFVGIEDRYGEGGPRTLGRRELRQKLAREGFQSMRFFYPYPDYKVPTHVLSSAAFQTDVFAPEELMSRVRSRDYCRPAVPLFHEELACHQLAENGLLEDLANSFLVVASPAPENDERPDVLGVVYSIGSEPKFVRKPVFKTRTEFRHHDGAVTVAKTLLEPGARLVITPGFEHAPLPRAPYQRGTVLSTLLIRRLLQDDRPAFFSLLGRWKDFLLATAPAPGFAQSLDAPIRPEYFDSTFDNLVVRDDGLEPFDLEWRIRTTFTIRSLMLRSLVHLFSEHAPTLKAQFHDDAYSPLSLAAALGVGATPEHLHAVLLLEEEFYGAVFDRYATEVRETNRGRSVFSDLKRAARRIVSKKDRGPA